MTPPRRAARPAVAHPMTSHEGRVSRPAGM